ncbi:uncharacterized protein Z520_00625 [Fonsecaea multimorphosa CBS 102226]|uniref:Uncharacterized protein n=1 Tax=Fonsecaea multimorphosa CBS 102226 TaxID=1442371 RepID=A0A0D2KCU2_9EURO|nr:uncharacterized protein Z520_00625 [Fonsecaea multimorphosa CBS 102226]KIY03933.1 hypothetical protein Z520_00625 [Fonsecaea multimorphosa CBS 102226]OAL31774.1 hypothetical protein AYO22_00644 [Fonsecaea multimorphosa]
MVLPTSSTGPTQVVHGFAEGSPGISPSSSPQPSSRDTVAAAATVVKPPLNPLETLEEQDFIRAVHLSLQDQAQGKEKSNTQAGPSHRKSLSSKSGEPSVPLVLSLNNEFTPLDDKTGDTAIYFGPPPQMPEQNHKDYDYIRQHFDRVHVVQSRNLRLMGDESRFSERDLLNPTKSFRAERKLRKLGVLNRAEAEHGGKFKYYIDLRPPNEDDEAVILITDLTCTRGVLTWHLAMKKYDLSPLAVLGHDEFGVQPHVDMLLDPVTSMETTEGASPDTSNTTKPRSGSHSSSEQPASPTTPASNPPIPPEYSPLRHWSALERLLQAIQGNDPKLDSAPKVWTFFAVSRYFGCATHERISGWIMTWLYSGDNSNFIQNNPEVAYRIGMGIRSTDLIKDSFSILVGERALVEACGEFNPEILTRRLQSVHGRKLELLDDDERNRIDHAASSFVKRIREIVCSMYHDMDFLHKNAAYAILDNAVGQTQGAVEALKSTKSTVREYIRSRIYYVLCQDQGSLRGLESDPKSTLPFRSASVEDYGTVYRSLNQQMRHFTKTFWTALQYTQFDEGYHNTSNKGTAGMENDTHYHKSLRGIYDEDPLNGISRVPRRTLERKINAINEMFHRREIVHGKPSPKRRKTSGANDFDHAFRETDNAISSSTVRMSIAPSWKPSPLKPVPTIPAPGMEPPVFSLRSKPTGTGSGSQQTNTNVAYSSFGRQADIPIRPKQTAPEVARMNSDTQYPYGQGTMFERHIPAESTATHPSNSTPAAPMAADNASSSTSSASNTFYNPYTGIYERLNLPNVEEPNPWTGYRVKQFFSNSNTDTEGDMSPSLCPYHSPIDPIVLLNDVSRAIETICSRVLYPPHLFHQTGLLPTDLYDNLTCLNANEFRYLPLWVPDGNDDGTGGVFEEVPVPNLDPIRTSIESFGPGRIKRGFDQADTEVSSDADEITSSQAISTVGKASKLATDGTRTVKSVSIASTINVKREHAFAGRDDSDIVDVGKTSLGVDDEGDTDMPSIDDDDEDGATAAAIDDDDDDENPFEDGDSDSDGFQWDDEPAKASPTGSRLFGTANEDGAGLRDGSQGQARARTQITINDASSEMETIPPSDAEGNDNTARKDSGKDKAKAKAQDLPHGFNFDFAFADPDLPHLCDRDPTTNIDTETEQARPLHHQPQVRRPHHDRASTSSSASSVVWIDKDDGDDDDDFELI